MSIMLDIIFSMLFGAMLFMIVLSANNIAMEEQSTHSGDMIVQEMLTSTAQLIEGELRNMGFGVPESEATIVLADSTRISFLVARDHTGSVIDTVTYWVGDTTDLSGTQNSMDRLLYRRGYDRVDLTILTQSVGTITYLRFRYYTFDGTPLPMPVPLVRRTEIHIVEVTMEVQNPYALYRPPNMVAAGEREALYSTSLWQQTRLASMNSRR